MVHFVVFMCLMMQQCGGFSGVCCNLNSLSVATSCGVKGSKVAGKLNFFVSLGIIIMYIFTG